MHKNAPESTTARSSSEPTRTVRVARPSDLSFVLHLQKTWSNNVGFLTKAAHTDYLDTKQTLLILENGSPAGYLNWTCTRAGLVRIPQLALEPELLRTTIGTKIMRHLRRAAVRGNCSIIRARSRSDLPVNLFWPQLGFSLTATFLNPTTRGLPLFEWTCPLIDSTDLIQGLITAGKSLRPLLKKRSHPSLKDELLTSQSN